MGPESLGLVFPKLDEQLIDEAVRECEGRVDKEKEKGEGEREREREEGMKRRE